MSMPIEILQLDCSMFSFTLGVFFSEGGYILASCPQPAQRQEVDATEAEDEESTTSERTTV